MTSMGARYTSSPVSQVIGIGSSYACRTWLKCQRPFTPSRKVDTVKLGYSRLLYGGVDYSRRTEFLKLRPKSERITHVLVAVAHRTYIPSRYILRYDDGLEFAK